jgi:hypothetical protein
VPSPLLAVSGAAGAVRDRSLLCIMSFGASLISSNGLYNRFEQKSFKRDPEFATPTCLSEFSSESNDYKLEAWHDEKYLMPGSDPRKCVLR